MTMIDSDLFDKIFQEYGISSDIQFKEYLIGVFKKENVEVTEKAIRNVLSFYYKGVKNE